MNFSVYKKPNEERRISNSVSSNTRNMIESYISLEDSIRTEFGTSILTESVSTHDEGVVQRCLDFFTEDSYDPAQFDYDQDKINNFLEALEVKFKNNINAINNHLYESAGTNGGLGQTNLNAIVGLSLPLSKMILMNNMFLNTMPVMVSDSKIINKDFEVRYLVDPRTGNRIDMYKDQNKIFDILHKSNPVKELVIPVNTEVDAVVELALGSTENINNVYIESVKVDVQVEIGDILPDGTIAESQEEKELDIKIGKQLNESYNGPSFNRDIIFNGRSLGKIFVGRDINKISFMAINNKFKSVKMLLTKDNSNLTDIVPRVEWEIVKNQISIDHEVSLSTSYTLQLRHDYKSLHDVDLLSTIVESSKIALDDYKDTYINLALDEDYENTLNNLKVYREVDFASKQNFTGIADEWIQSTFKNSFDEVVDALVRIVNDPNVEILVYGRPILIEKVLPKNSEGRIDFSNKIGSQNIEYAKSTITTSNKKAHFISSQKLTTDTNNLLNNTFKIVLNPTNDRTMYTIAEYQTYIGPDIKTAKDAHLPGITAFDRFELLKFEGVQGRMPILNISGIRQGETDATIGDLNTTVAGVDKDLRVIKPGI